MGLALAGFGTILGAVNFITTIFCMRAPGMTMFRMPIFTWNILLTSVLVLMAFPVLAAALLALEADRKFGAHVFDPANDGAILWQHLFWFFGHPEVYIIALPFFGIVSEILPVFSRKPIFGYKGLVFATIAIAGLSVTVWAHHMFPTGAVLLPFFSFMTFLIAVPDRREVLQLDRHDVARVADVRDADAVGDRLPRDVPVRRPHRHDPGLAAAGLAGLRHLLRGRALPLRRVRHRRVRDVRRVLLLVAEADRPDARRAARQDPLLDAVRRLPHDVPDPALAGRRSGMPRRYVDYLASDGFTTLQHDLDDRVVPARRLDAAVPLQRVEELARARRSPTDDPWGYGRSLEWATSCPPPRHNFLELPRIRSESPAFDLHYPHVAPGPRSAAPPNGETVTPQPLHVAVIHDGLADPAARHRPRGDRRVARVARRGRRRTRAATGRAT